MTVPLSQKISGNRSYSVVFVFFFFKCFFLSEKELALLSVCFSWARCAFDVSRGQQFSQIKHPVVLAVLLHVANVSYWLQALTEPISHDGELSREGDPWFVYTVFSPLCYAVTVSRLVFLWETASLNLAVPLSRSSKGSNAGSLPFTVWIIP